MTQSPYTYIYNNDSSAELINGPSRKSMYVTALYFTMTCMTSVSSISSSSGSNSINSSANTFILVVENIVIVIVLVVDILQFSYPSRHD